MGNRQGRKMSTVPAGREARSRITNGAAFLPDVDHRSTWVRRCRDLIGLYLSDLGGDDNVSEGERSIVRRIAVMTVEIERVELRLAMCDEPSDRLIDLYIRSSGNLRRMLETIGLERRAKDITSLGQILREGQHG
jgi:hypothetical protein